MDTIRQVAPTVPRTLLLLCAAWLAGGCGGGPDELCRVAPPVDEAAYVAEIEQARRDKERHFRHAEDSPVPAADRAGWSGLEFYPVDPRWRLEGPLVRRMTPRPVEIPDTGGTVRAGEEIGYFLVDLGAGPERLPLFRMEEGDDFFLPFTDATTEVETYPAGRYLEIEPLGGDRFRLDFNLAYNPWCAYGGDWSCPLTPGSNRLEAAVRAGERGYRYQHE